MQQSMLITNSWRESVSAELMRWHNCGSEGGAKEGHNEPQTEKSMVTTKHFVGMYPSDYCNDEILHTRLLRILVFFILQFCRVLSTLQGSPAITTFVTADHDNLPGNIPRVRLHVIRVGQWCLQMPSIILVKTQLIVDPVQLKSCVSRLVLHLGINTREEHVWRLGSNEKFDNTIEV